MAVNNIVYKISAIDLLSPALKNINNEADKTDGKVSGIGTMASLSFAAAAAGAAAFGLSIINTTNKLESLQNQLKFASGSAAQGAADFEYIKDLTNKLGLEFETSANSFAKFEGATRGTILAGEETKKIFEGVASAGTVMHLSSEEMSGALTAIQQMVSKGKVSAEELNGQLGERLPGALGIAARSMGLSTSGLMDMMKQGKLLSEDFLPKFAKQLKDEFGPGLENASKSGISKMNRLSNGFLYLKQSVGESTKSIQSSVIDMLIKTTEKFQKLFDLIVKHKTIVISTIYGVAAAITVALIPSIIAATDSFVALTAVLLANPFTWIVLGIAAFVAVLKYLYETSGKVRGAFKALIPVIGVLANSLKFLIAPIIYMIDLLMSRDIKGAWDRYVNLTNDAVNGVKDNIKEIPKAFQEGIKQVADESILKEFMDKAKLIHDARFKAFQEGNKKELEELQKHADNLAKIAAYTYGSDAKTRGKIQSAMTIGVPKNLTTGASNNVISNVPKSRKKATDGVSGPHITTINITMGNLVGELSVNTTNLKEGTVEIKNLVTDVLVQALRESQYIVK